jgi:hypothetical protein
MINRKSRALQMADTKAVFEAVLNFYCDFIVGKDGHARLKDSDISKIENEALDFILDFYSRALTGKVCNAARYGSCFGYDYEFYSIGDFMTNSSV